MRAEIVGATSSEFETVSVIVPPDSELGQELAAIERDYPEGIPCEDSTPSRVWACVGYAFAAGALAVTLTCLLIYVRYLNEGDGSTAWLYGLVAVGYSAVVGPVATLIAALVMLWRGREQRCERVQPTCRRQSLPEWGSNYRD